MSNKKSNHLFELIKSLSKSEKRYFKLYSSRHTIGEQNNYISLFDYIEKMTIYDEDLIFKDFKGEAFINRFSITKGRLYNNILKSLDLFYATHSADAQLYRLINSADILFNKGLYQQAGKMLLSAEKHATKYGKDIILLEIKDKQKKIIEKELYSKLKTDQLSKLYQAESDILNEIKKHQKLWNSKSILFNEINKKGAIRSDEDIKNLTTIIKEMSSISIKTSNSKVKYLYNHIHSAYYFAINDLTNCYDHIVKNKAIIESDSHLFEDSPNTYFSIITNLIYIATKLKKYDEGKAYLKILKDIPDSKGYQSTTDLDIKYFSSIYSLELFLKIEQSAFAEAEKLVPEIKAGLLKFDANISNMRKAYLDFKIAIVYLSLGKFDHALIWITRILNSEGLDKKQDIYCFAQIINLIIHFELKNLRFLPYALNSTKRYLKGRNRMFKFETIFLKAIGKISKIDVNKFDLEEILLPISEELKALKNDPFERIVFDYFDFSAWVESKINGKSYQELQNAG